MASGTTRTNTEDWSLHGALPISPPCWELELHRNGAGQKVAILNGLAFWAILTLFIEKIQRFQNHNNLGKSPKKERVSLKNPMPRRRPKPGLHIPKANSSTLPQLLSESNVDVSARLVRDARNRKSPTFHIKKFVIPQRTASKG